MAGEDRYSEAQEVELITDPVKLAEAESYNVVKQYRKIEEMVSYFLDPERPFKLRPSHLLTLHREALEGISPLAGVFRPGGVKIYGSAMRHPTRGKCRNVWKNFAITSMTGGKRRSRSIWPLT